MTPRILELDEVLREHWCDPFGEKGEPKVKGEFRKIQDQKQELPDSSPGHFLLDKLSVYLET